MGDAGGAVLVAAGIAAVGVALAVADEDRDVTLKDIAVHQHRITAVGMAQVHHIGGILAVMAGDLTGIVEFVEQLLAEDLPHLRDRGTGVQAVGDHQQHVLLFHAAGVELVQAGPDGYLAVAGGLAAALDDVGDHDDRRLSGGSQLAQGRHIKGLTQRADRFVVQHVPVLRQAGRIGHRLAGDKYLGAVRKLCTHQAVTVFKIKLHCFLPPIRSFQIRGGTPYIFLLLDQIVLGVGIRNIVVQLLRHTVFEEVHPVADIAVGLGGLFHGLEGKSLRGFIEEGGLTVRPCVEDIGNATLF